MAVRFLPRTGGRRAPLRTCTELAEELGTSPGILAKLMNADPNGPRPAMDNRGKANDQKVWYAPAAVRAWWAARQEARK